MKQEIVSELDGSLEVLERVGSKGVESEELRRAAESLKQVYDAVTDKVC